MLLCEGLWFERYREPEEVPAQICRNAHCQFGAASDDDGPTSAVLDRYPLRAGQVSERFDFDDRIDWIGWEIEVCDESSLTVYLLETHGGSPFWAGRVRICSQGILDEIRHAISIGILLW